MKLSLKHVVALGFCTTAITYADLEWGYAGDLAAFDLDTVNSGWFVQLYRDVDKNTDVSSIFQFNNDGTPSGSNVSDDVLLTSFTTTLITGKGGTQYGQNFLTAEWSFLTGENVYTVIFDSTTIATASRAVVVDATSTTLPAVTDPPQQYLNFEVNNEWVTVIPEPTTMALLLTGIGGLFGLRRRMLK